MKRKSSKPPAAPQEGLKSPTARVSITQIVPDPDETVQLLIKGPARLPGFVRQSIKFNARLVEAAPLIQKGLKHTEAEAKGLKAENQKRRREAAVKYETIRKFAEQVIAADPKLQRANANRLAIKIHKQRPDWSERTIRRALDPDPKK
jgi:hypothetical protein